MFELKGKILTSRYYARNVPNISLCVYEMSHVEKSSFFFKTIPFPTRIIDLQSDFVAGYSKRLRKYIQNIDVARLEIRRPNHIADLMDIYQAVVDEKGLDPIPPDYFKRENNFIYSEIHHERLGRLAAHVSIGDRKEQKVFGLINASDYRSFDSKTDQRLCSTANKYLFHVDMLHFQSLGYFYYDMVGTREPMNQMKKEFGGEIVMTYTHVPYIIHYLQKLKTKGISLLKNKTGLTVL